MQIVVFSQRVAANVIREFAFSLHHDPGFCNLPSGRFAGEAGQAMGTVVRTDRRVTPGLRARRTLASLRAGLLASSSILVTALPALALDATSNAVPVDSNFNNANNWTPATVPTGTASFGTSSITNLTFSAGSTIVGGWTFNAGASNYAFNVAPAQTLVFNSAGIAINGGGASIADNAGGSSTSTIAFLNASTAGSASITNNSGTGSGGVGGTATLSFQSTSTAGNATITNTTGAFGIAQIQFFNLSTAGNAIINNANTGAINNNSIIQFFGTSTAGNANITNDRTLQFSNGSTAGNATITNNAVVDFFLTSTAGNAIITENGFMAFHDTSTAGNATITNNGGTGLGFADTSTAGNATIINNFSLAFGNSSTAANAIITNNSGGTTLIRDSASGGTARFILNGTGALDISGLTTGGTTAGSIEGGGNVRLGANTLTVGGNNLSTIFSGVIQDGGTFGGIGGSLVKTGSGMLTLAGANTYSGSTTINAGTLALSGFGLCKLAELSRDTGISQREDRTLP
jgi:autotransporter-associated beta strand protein